MFNLRSISKTRRLVTMNQTEQEFKTTKEIVEHILATDERARCDDKWLILQVIRATTFVYVPYQDLDRIPSFETITRCRRIIQNNEGRFLASYQTVKKRVLREQAVKRIVMA
jgi:hypothetical protein